jgi:hypothetical protein
VKQGLGQGSAVVMAMYSENSTKDAVLERYLMNYLYDYENLKGRKLNKYTGVFLVLWCKII